MKDIFNIKGAIKGSFEKERLSKLWAAFDYGTLEHDNFSVFALCEYQREVSDGGHAGFFAKHSKGLDKYNDSLKKILPDDLYENFAEAYKSLGTKDEGDSCESADQVLQECEEVVNAILTDYAVKKLKI